MHRHVIIMRHFTAATKHLIPAVLLFQCKIEIDMSGGNSYKMSNPFFFHKYLKNITNLLSAYVVIRVPKVNKSNSLFSRKI